MELSVSSETTSFNMKLQLEICPQLRTGSSAEDTGRIDTRSTILYLLLLKLPPTGMAIMSKQYRSSNNFLSSSSVREKR